MRAASVACVKWRGFRNSSRSITPGGVGRRYFGARVVVLRDTNRLDEDGVADLLFGSVSHDQANAAAPDGGQGDHGTGSGRRCSPTLDQLVARSTAFGAAVRCYPVFQGKPDAETDSDGSDRLPCRAVASILGGAFRHGREHPLPHK